MQKARRHSINELRPVVSTRFQVLFTPLFGVLFTFPSRYWFTIGLSGVFSLTGWCRQIHARLLRPRATQDTTNNINSYSYGTITLCGMAFQPSSDSNLCSTAWSYYPIQTEIYMVWAVPRSLATTYGITVVFFSYGYLDVSVPHVRLPYGIS